MKLSKRKFANFFANYREYIALFIATSALTIVSGYVAFFTEKTRIDDNVVYPNALAKTSMDGRFRIQKEERSNIQEEQENKRKTNRPIEHQGKRVPSQSSPSLAQGEKEIFQESFPFFPTILVIGDRVYSVSIPEGISVREMMERASKEHAFSFKGKDYAGLGFFVEEIAGINNDLQKGIYWIYYINGTKANLGVSTYRMKLGDTISWQYESEE